MTQLALFNAPLAPEFHGTSVGLARHTDAGEDRCGRCQSFLDELVAAGLAAPRDDAGRAQRPALQRAARLEHAAVTQ